MKRAITALSFVTAASLFCASGLAQAVPTPGQVVISALYGGGGNSGARFTHDFVELHNRTNSALDVSGFTLQRGGATSAGGTAGASNTTLAFPAGTVIPAGGYVLVRAAAGAGGTDALPAPFIDNTANSGGMTMGAGNGKMALVSNATLVANWDATTIIDYVAYGLTGTNPTRTGDTSLGALSNTTAMVRKDGGCTDTDNSLADFDIVNVGPGTTYAPRTSASGAFICGVPTPNLAVTLATTACGLTSGSSITLVATASNIGTADVNGATVTITLPLGTTGIVAPGATVAGNVITWAPGSIVPTGITTLNITGTVNTQGTFLATATAPAVAGETDTNNNNAAARAFVPFSGPGYNATVTPLLVAVPLAQETALSWNAGTLGEFNDGFGANKIRTIPGRPVPSANGNRFAFWTNSGTGDSGGTTLNFDGWLLAGQISGGSATLTAIANEGTTPIDGARFIRSGVAFPAPVTAPVINNNGDVAFAVRLRDSADPTDTTEPVRNVVARTTVASPSTFTIVARQTEQVTSAVGGAGVLWGNLSAASIQSDGTVSFASQLTGTGITTANDFAVSRNNGNTLVGLKGTTPATGMQGTNAGSAITAFNNGFVEANSYSVDASGSNVLISGTARLAGTGAATDDAFVMFNGNVVLQEGFPIAGASVASNVATFDTALVQADGSWYTIGTFAPTPPATTGPTFLVRNGTLLATVGDVIASGSTETWSNANSRAFQSFTSNGADQVIFGLTNSADLATDNVAVWRNGSNSQVILREGQPLTINGRTFSVGFVPAQRAQAWITADRKLVALVSLYTPENICQSNFNNATAVQALVSVDLPTAGPSCNSRANFAGPNQSSTPDAALTADDIIVFLGHYFSGATGAPIAGNPASPTNRLADISGANQNASQPDGQLTADDIIVFLGFYFQGCP
jgi:hypothetical protein